MKAGIQGAAGLNSEGIEGFPLSLSLRCPSTLLTEGVETDTRSARIVWCSCFRLRGRKHGYGEHTARENKYQEIKKEMKS